MYIDDIRKKWNDGGYSYSETIPQKVKPDHVFDVNKTVRENREMAESFNQDVTMRRKEAQAKQAALYNQFTCDVVSYLMDTYKFSEVQAKRVESYVYTEKHSYMGDYFGALDEIADMVSDVLTL